MRLDGPPNGRRRTERKGTLKREIVQGEVHFNCISMHKISRGAYLMIAAANSPARPRPAVRIGETGGGLTSLQVSQGLAALFKG